MELDGHESAMDDDLTSLNWLQDQNLLDSVTGRSSRLLPRSHEIDRSDIPVARGAAVVVLPVTYDPRVHVYAKPPYSFSSLIFLAIESTPRKALPVKEIYSWIEQNFPFYRTAPCGWKNTIRHNLSLSKCFRKVDRCDEWSTRCTKSRGKGSHWSVDPSLKSSLLQSAKRAAFHVYPFVSTSRTSSAATIHPLEPKFSVQDMQEIQNVRLTAALTESKAEHTGVKCMGEASDEHNYSSNGCLEQENVTSDINAGNRQSLLDGDDDGLKGAAVLLSFSRIRRHEHTVPV